MSYVDKVINAKVKQTGFIKQNLPQILKKANDACKSILVKAKQRGIQIEDDQVKDLHAKSMMEGVNRLIFNEVYAELKQSDQAQAKQPGLVAHPATVMPMPDCNLNQLSGERFTKLMHQGYVVVNDFLEHREAS